MIECSIIEMFLDSGTVRFTDNGVDIDYEGETYSAGMVKPLDDLEILEDGTMPQSEYKMTFSGIDGTMVSIFAGNPYKGRRVLVRNLEFNESGNVIFAEVTMDAIMSHYSYTCSERTIEITLTLVPSFTSLYNNNSLDLAIAFAEFINSDAVTYWGKNAPRTRAGGSGSTGNRYKYDEDLANPVITEEP